MGAMEWTTGASASYSAYSPLQSTSYSYENPGIPDYHSNYLPTGETKEKLFNFGQINIDFFHYYFTAVIPDVAQSYCPAEYHSSSSSLVHQTGSLGCTGTSYSTSAKADMDASYSSYNNWTNGYNNYQYPTATAPPPPAAQAQYGPHQGPTMVLYPQLYSTVNQNQIHLHLHASDKLEQYFGPENSFTITAGE
jgi:hypothetical protein